MSALNDYQLRQIVARCFVGATETDAVAARRELHRRYVATREEWQEDFDTMIDRSQCEGWCAVDATEFCLTHQCGVTLPCGRLTCQHCRGDDGAGADAV